MEIVTTGCTLPVDLVIGGTCLGGSIVLTLGVSIALIIFFGVLRFGGRKLSAAFQSPEQRAADFAIDQVGRTLRLLIAMAASDGHLTDEEVGVIRYVGLKYFNFDFEENTIRQISTEMGSQIDIEAEIQGNIGGLSLRDENAITALVQGMTAVAACDGTVCEAERALLKRIATALGARSDTITKMIDQAEAQSAQWRITAA